MGALYDAIKNYLDEQEWRYNYDEEDRYFSMGMNLKEVDSCRVYIQMRGSDDAFTIYSVLPVKAPEDKRSAVAEFITRANYGLIHGNFEMDYEDGEIRYKVTTACGDIDLGEEPMDRIINTGFCMLDRYGKGLLSVIYGNANPAAIIDEIENADD
ncbi:MAG: YbjN domain-containing protein [Anaerotruncus sp.]|nr:YbjN domain-containing protein [Anaerotruncus sp.]